MNASLEPSFEAAVDDSSTRMALGGVVMAARGNVVNRTHRVVRAQAKVMQARRSRARELMLPMILCSSLLLLTAFAVWSGWYQNPASAAETVETDVAALAAMDANNHYIVALLWFVPVCVAVLATVLYRRPRGAANDRTAR